MATMGRPSAVIVARAQEPLTTKGTTSPACFFTCLAAFFSFGDSKAFFFASLLDFWDLDMVFAPDHVEGTPEERWEAELKGVCPDGPLILLGWTLCCVSSISVWGRKSWIFAGRAAMSAYDPERCQGGCAALITPLSRGWLPGVRASCREHSDHRHRRRGVMPRGAKRPFAERLGE
jgi:hypothetical protein